MIEPLISIIIVSYNTKKLLESCLKSVLADKGLFFDLATPQPSKNPAEIIVVDNNSQDDTLQMLKKFPQVKLIINQQNNGFGPANNQAMSIAKGNYFLLLNTDTLILHSAISQTLDWLSSHPESYACTAQLLNSDKTIQASGGFFPNLSNIFTWSFGLDDLPLVNSLVKPFHPHPPTFYTHDQFYLHDHSQDWITGAYILIRKSAFKQTGGFNPHFFMYGEEVEWFYRLHQKYPQSSVNYLVGPQIIHLGGGSSTSKNFPIVKEIHGVIAFFKLHSPPWKYHLVRFLLKLNPSLRLRALFFLVIGSKEKANFYLQSCSQI